MPVGSYSPHTPSPDSRRSRYSSFPRLTAETRADETVLSGPVPDQAALHGLLAQIEALGLELLEVSREDV